MEQLSAGRSREAAKERSPRRKPWVLNGTKSSPEGAKEKLPHRRGLGCALEPSFADNDGAIISTTQPRRGERIQPTAQAVGTKWAKTKPRRGEKKLPHKLGKDGHEFSHRLQSPCFGKFELAANL